MRRASDARAVGLLFFLVLLTSLPFVNRAYFVDDYYHVTMAKGLLQHPLRPYDFLADDAGPNNKGWERGRPPRMVNPPLFHYYVAGVMALWGDAVWKMRTSTLIFPLISVFCMYFLGKRFTPRPFACAVLMALAPAFWLTSYSLLIDGALTAFFLASLLTFFIGHERRHLGFLALSGLLMGLTILTKYTGALVVAVAILWQWDDKDRWAWAGSYVAYGVCLIVLGFWGAWTLATYGQVHFLAAIHQSGHPSNRAGDAFAFLGVMGFIVGQTPLKRLSRIPFQYVLWGICLILSVIGWRANISFATWIQNFYIDKFLVLGSFIGGSTLFLLLSPKLLWDRSKQAFIAWGLMEVMLFLAFTSPLGGFSKVQSFLLSFFIGSAAAFLAMIDRSPRTRTDPRFRFLVLWVFVGLLELVGAMQWTAGRYLLIILPPLCWLFENVAKDLGQGKIVRWAVFCTGGVGVLLAYADFTQANTVVALSQRLAEQQTPLEALAPRPTHHWYFLGDTFTGYGPYLLPLGWESSFPNQTFQTGDLLIRSRYRMSSWWVVPGEDHFKLLESYSFPSPIPLRVMDVPASAGFYASCWGALPFTITRHPLERFDLYQVQ